MRIYATARAAAQSNAVGQVELECTLVGLSVGLFGVAAYSEGYAPGALASGTRRIVPWSSVRVARATPEELYIEFEEPGFPHDRLTLTRFVHGPGVPHAELRRRRLILHFGALSMAVATSLTTAALAPFLGDGDLAWGALGYGIVAALIVLAFGYSVDQRLFLSPPGEEATRAAFLNELERFYPELSRGQGLAEPTKPRELPNLAGLLPRTVSVVGVTLAAAILTALVTGQRLLHREDRGPTAMRVEPDDALLPSSPTEPRPVFVPPPGLPDHAPIQEEAAPSDDDAPATTDGETVAIERRCACDRADSPLWPSSIPRLTALLLDRRMMQTRTHVRTEIEVAVINNGDAPVDEITLLVQFSEKEGGKLVPTKSRPLYFEGPLRPGQAIKWSAEARGTDFEISSPDIGLLGPSGEGAAPADSFFALLGSANHRPVRLHAARMLGYLGDPRAREAALGLKDAMRSQEGPYLRRVLAALGEVRTCDIDRKAASVGVCVFNAGDQARADVGVQLQALSQSLDVNQPLANPPERLNEKKWHVPGEIAAQAGVYVRLPVPVGFLPRAENALEVLGDRYTLLE